jgi:hypothetical protein
MVSVDYLWNQKYFDPDPCKSDSFFFLPFTHLQTRLIIIYRQASFRLSVYYLSTDKEFMAKKKVEDLTGKVFGKWEVQYSAPKRKQHHYWACICECGEMKEIVQSDLLSGKSTMCRACSNKKIVIKESPVPEIETIIAPIDQPAKKLELPRAAPTFKSSLRSTVETHLSLGTKQ